MAEYKHKSVAMEGRLHFEFENTKDGMLQFPVGHTRTDKGMSTLYALHSILEHLSGKTVRVSVEWNDDCEEPERNIGPRVTTAGGVGEATSPGGMPNEPGSSGMKGGG